MSEATQILSAAAAGDRQAAEKLLPLVYAELRKLAAAKLAMEKPGQTLQATALVHEAYLRLVGGGGKEPRTEEPKNQEEAGNRGQETAKWDSRAHFFGAAAEAMRRIVIENARRKRSRKGGGDLIRVDLDEVSLTIDREPDDLLALDEALGKLATEDGPAAALAKLRLFAGMTVDDAADSLGISRTTGFRHWTYARAFLQAELQPENPSTVD